MSDFLSCRFFRCVICFLLIGCVLINLSPLRAQALVIEGVAVATGVTISAPVAIAGILICLGITIGATSGFFDSLVDSCSIHLQNLGYVIEDKIQAYICDGKSYVEQDVVEAVRDYVWDSGTLTKSYVLETQDCDSYMYVSRASSAFCISGTTADFTADGSTGTITLNSDYFCWSGSYYNLDTTNFTIANYGSRPQFSISGSGCNVFYYDNYYSGWYFVFFTADKFLFSGARIKDGQSQTSRFVSFIDCEYPFYPSARVSTQEELTLENVTLDIIPFPTGYETWGNTALKVENPSGGGSDNGDPDDDNDIHIYPVTIPSDYSQVGDLTQESAQEGTYTESSGSTDSGSSSSPSTGTDYTSWFQKIVNGIQELPSKFETWISDCKTAIEELPSKFSEFFNHVVSEIQNLPSTFSQFFSDVVASIQSIPDAIKGIFAKSDNLDKKYDTDWQSVFPFCVPFDLIEFLGVLAAEPEAPVIQWRFYVPNICDENIEIDLSVFDTVAQIMRTLELLAFCIGLILLTRNIIRG